MKQPFIRFALLALLLTPFWSIAQDNPALKSTPTLTLEVANRMMEVASRRADELNEKVAIVIIGTEGLPLTIRRHEETPGLIYEQALARAQDAWLEKREIDAGFPVTLQNQRVGGIGVSGALLDQNREIGIAALDIFKDILKKRLPIQNTDKELLKIILYVKRSEMPETTHFYREAIGLQQLNPPADTGWVVFDTGTVNLCLREKDKSSARDKATNFALYSGTREEVTALHARLIKDGYKVTNDINPEKDKTMGRLREEKTMTTFWIKDPAGNTVQIESLRTN